MILFTRSVAQNFRLVFARCVTGRPRGPAPPVVVQIHDGIRTLTATTTEGVVLTHTSPVAKENDDLLVLPASVFAEVEGGTDEAVDFDRETKLRGVMKWNGGGQPRTQAIELILPGRQHQRPASLTLSVVSTQLLRALHECGRTAARESGRYALSKIQLQGQSGRVIGTDGKVALLWKEFRFPFADDVFVPALPVFGSKPVSRMPEAKIGRNATHLVVCAGPWSVWLPADTKVKFPDVAGVVPRHTPTIVEIDQSDAVALLPVLPGLPGGEHELRPVTLDADRRVCVRGRYESGEKSGATKEVLLERSTSSGPAIRVVLDRRVLARAFVLGCRTVRLTPDKPAVLEGTDITLLAAPLDPVLVAPPIATDSDIPTPTTNIERNSPVKPETNGHIPPRGDPLELAEELRAALSDAAGIAARLVTVLRHGKKEKKVLASVLTNLKQLNWGGTS